MFKKLLSALIFSSLLGMGANAQFNTIAQSSEFSEPQTGNAKILKDENGNTIFLHLGNKGELTIKAYSPEKKLIYDKVSDYVGPKRNQRDITALFTNNDELVIFVMTRENKKPTLNRVLIDLKTGNLKSVTEIDQLNKFARKEGYAVVMGNVPLPDYFIRKDPNSDAYAIVAFNSFESNRNFRIHSFHYDGAHNLLSASNYQSPDNEYKYMNFNDIYVDGNKAVYIVAVGQNTKKSGGDQEGKLFLGKISKGESTFELKDMGLKNAKNISKSYLRYNPMSDKMLLTSVQQLERKEKKKLKVNYKSHLTTFDKSLENIDSKELNFKQLNNIAKTQFKKREEVNASPNNFIVNQDGTSVITLEEPVVKVTTTTNKNGSMSTRYSYFLNDLGAVKYDIDGNVTSANYIPKSHHVLGLPGGLYYSYRDQSMASLGYGMQFKGFQYLDAPNATYILYNDMPSNIEKMQKGKKMKTVSRVSGCTGYYFKLDGNKIPKGQKVLKGSGKEKSYLLLYDVSHYDKVNNEYVTMKVQNKKAQIIWLQPQ